MPALEARHWTADDVRALPDELGKRFECVDGELLVSPNPHLPHQSAVGFLLQILAPFARQHAIGAVFMAPGDIELDRFTLVQPDVFVLPLVSGRRPRTAEEIGHPLLFIEVLSPSTARYDRVVKRGRYQRANIEYWIVDLEARLLERWPPDADRPFIHTAHVTWELPNVPELTVDLSALFIDALGDP
ncbi:Uma2 family endonuclease [Gemmatimonas sp.]|uniref:Uma2 family endonuclease n=1 Tax=Gemmatimonas sp. TaxID=1962908 RepID=UPI0031C1A6AC|nr:Uma2 family endonuclease [Gemmatimonas sp.]